MTRFMVLPTAVALLVAVSVPTARAVPTDSKIIVGAKAQRVSAGAVVNVSVTYVCPASFGAGFVVMLVSQAETGASGTSIVPAPCTDDREKLLVPVPALGPPFALGQAIAQAFLAGEFAGDSDVRRIQIVQ